MYLVHDIPAWLETMSVMHFDDEIVAVETCGVGRMAGSGADVVRWMSRGWKFLYGS